MGKPVDTGAEAIMDDATLEATFAHIERWSELDLPICANLRMHCKALQSALAAALHETERMREAGITMSRASDRHFAEARSLHEELTAAQQRISDLEAQCARVQRDADEARELAAFNKSGWDGSFRQAMLNGAAANTYRKLIEDHNADCHARCGVGDQEAVRCGYRKYFLNSRRRCPECPTYETIDMPDDAAMAAKVEG